jgi:ParB family transcriptional regulator, chromosome partitioning protein
MTTPSTAEKVIDKEKVEKRRALGRGLESLLPRVIMGSAARAVAPAQSGNAPPSANEASAGAAISAEPPADSPSSAQNDSPPFAKDAKDGAPVAVIPAMTAMTGEARTASAHEAIEIHAQAEGAPRGNLVVQIALDQIERNPHQTRHQFDQDMLEELANSIKANGVMQPVVVRPGADGRYILILGERRCRASKLAGKATVPAIVRRVSEQQAAEMTIIENLQREDLNPLEQAEGFAKLSRQFGLTQEQIGDRVGLSRESVSNYMRLLKLPLDTREHLKYNRLGFGEARELLALENLELADDVANEAVKRNWTVDQIEERVAQLNGWPVSHEEAEKRRGGARWVDPNVRAAQTELERLLGMRVRIKDRRGKGKIVIEYASVDDYDRVVGALRGK